jgi:TrpR-related protein YerC/YecD
MKSTLDIDGLYDAFLSIKTKDEMERFLKDLCTPKEIESFAERWTIAQLLNDGQLGYREIAEQVCASTTTVTRVARFLHQENYGGYKIALSRKLQK